MTSWPICRRYSDDPFERESAIAAQIEHPNVIPVYSVGEDRGTLFIAMRFVAGIDLATLIAQNGRIEPRRAAAIADQVAGALDAAHGHGLIHRDVKPANILLSSVGIADHVYLTDFGLSRHVEGTAGLTQSGAFIGTYDYVAPEQARSERVDARTDVYSLGCVLFHALTGTVPFPGDNSAAKIYAHVATPPPSVCARAPEVPAAFEPVLIRAMAKAPDERYPSAGDLGRAAVAASRLAPAQQIEPVDQLPPDRPYGGERVVESHDALPESSLEEVQSEEDAIRRRAEAAARQAEEDAVLLAEEAAARRANAEQVNRRKDEEAAVRRRADDAAVLKRAEEDAIRQQAKEDAIRRRAEDDAVRKRTDEDAVRKRAEQAAFYQRLEQGAARLAKEAAVRRRAEQDAVRKRAEQAWAEQAAAGPWAGQAAARRAKEAAIRRQAEGDAVRQRAAEAAARRAKEAAVRRQAGEDVLYHGAGLHGRSRIATSPGRTRSLLVSPRVAPIAVVFVASAAVVLAAVLTMRSWAPVLGLGSPVDNGFDAKAPAAIVTAAQQAADTVTSVHVSGSMPAKGAPTTFDLHLVKGTGGTGMLSVNGMSFRVIRIGSTIYVKGSTAFYKQFSGSAASLLDGKWLKGSSTSGSFKSIGAFTDLTSFVDQALAAPPGQTLTKGAKTTIAGQKVVEVKDPSGGTLSIATSGQPFPVRIVQGGADGGSITFDHWNSSVALVAPANAVDLANLQAGSPTSR
jgi:hypothetical protein